MRGDPRDFVHRYGVRVRKSLSRELARRGTTCRLCPSPVHHAYIELGCTDEALDAPWGYAQRSWLDWLDRVVPAAPALCAYHRLLARVKAHPDWVPVRPDHPHAVDVERKRGLHSRLVAAMGGVCATCGRAPDPAHPWVGFDLNHVVCLRAGGDKDRALSYYWLDWSQHQPPSKKQRLLNREGLAMTYEDAEQRMRREATKCDVQCRSCHEAITDAQNKHDVSWGWVLGELERRIAPGVVRALCGYPDTIQINI